MSKLYHITVKTPTGYQPLQQDIIASNAAVAVRRALDDRALRSARSVHIECNVSNHGEYDKARFICYDLYDGMTYTLLDQFSGKFYRPPSHIRRNAQAERLGIEAQRILDRCPNIKRVHALCRGNEVDITRAGA